MNAGGMKATVRWCTRMREWYESAFCLLKYCAGGQEKRTDCRRSTKLQPLNAKHEAACKRRKVLFWLSPTTHSLSLYIYLYFIAHIYSIAEVNQRKKKKEAFFPFYNTEAGEGDGPVQHWLPSVRQEAVEKWKKWGEGIESEPAVLCTCSFSFFFCLLASFLILAFFPLQRVTTRNTPPPPTSKKGMHKQTHYTNKRKDIYSQTSNDSSPHPQASFLSCAEEKGHYIQSTRFFFF